MIRTRWACAAVSILASTALVGCSQGGSDGPASGRSTLSVSLMDAPVDGVTAVHVRITSMWIKPTGGPAVELPLVKDPLDVNLLALTDTNAAILLDNASIEAGSYEWLAMDIAAVPGERDSYVLTETGAEEEIETDLRVPSGRLRLVSGFDVPPNEAVRLLFDWDMRQGLVYPPGQGQYLLKPAFRMLDVTAYGVLQGTIAATTVGTSLDPAVNHCATDDVDLDVGNIVYVFTGSAAPNDIDGTRGPIAAGEATYTPNGYVYRTLIDPGVYTVVFTCEGGNDDPESVDDISFLNSSGTTNPITNTGNATSVDF